MSWIVHQWVARARCPECATYLWTTPGSPSVVCKCGASSIMQGVVESGLEVVSEAEFEAAVAKDLMVDSNFLIVERV